MTSADIIIQERHREKVQALLAQAKGAEGAVYMLLGRSAISRDPWSEAPRVRYTSYAVLEVPPEDVVSADERHVTWLTSSFVRLLKRAQAEGLVPAIVHNHPGGFDGFSPQDDENEKLLYELARNRNGTGQELVSVVQVGDDFYRARVWSDRGPTPCGRVTIVGSGLEFQDMSLSTLSITHSRQALAFGSELNDQVRGLSVGVVGCGGTGSPLVHLIARLGVGRLLVVDDDIVEESNLNRLQGATLEDAKNETPKVDVMAREVSRMGLGAEISAVKGWGDTPEARDALRSCDVIFGCTDDHAGRIFLDRLARFYLIPVIDVGLALLPREDEQPGLREMAARTTVLVPGSPCLSCRGIAIPIRAREEDLERRDPEEFERQKAEAYVIGGGDPAPSVVTFTTEAATMAVNELIQGLVDYRGEGKWAWNRYRRLDRVEERRQGVKTVSECGVCADPEIWGRGDVEPFLDRMG